MSVSDVPTSERAPRVLELFDLRGKVALVTGGGSGLGRQAAQALAEMGAHVALCARKVERCELVGAELAALGAKTLALRCDVRDSDEVDTVIGRTVEELGRLDILVNNAGTTWAAWPEEVSPEGWQKVIDVNLSGVFFCSQAAGRVMIAQGGGKIINVASVMGLIGAPPELMNAIPYNASKGGVINLTRDLACKWAGHAINVNAIAPGWFPSDMSRLVLEQHGDALIEQIPLHRFGGGHDLKGAVAFLASAASDYVTGHTLVVDGGESAW